MIQGGLPSKADSYCYRALFFSDALVKLGETGNAKEWARHPGGREQIPMGTWNYKTQDPSIRHIGPMAQDFYAAFGLGVDDRHIGTVDADGVALAAIQGLYDVVHEKDAAFASLQGQNSELLKRVEALEHAGVTGSAGRHPLTAAIPLPWVVLVLGGFLALAALLGPGLYMRRQR